MSKNGGGACWAAKSEALPGTSVDLKMNLPPIRPGGGWLPDGDVL